MTEALRKDSKKHSSGPQAAWPMWTHKGSRPRPVWVESVSCQTVPEEVRNILESGNHFRRAEGRVRWVHTPVTIWSPPGLTNPPSEILCIQW